MPPGYDQDELRAWCVLANSRMRTAEFLSLAAHLGDARSIAAARAPALRKLGCSDERIARITAPDDDAIGRELEWLGSPGHHLVPCGSDAYPELLARIDDPPLVLYVNGDPGSLHLPALSIVGSRNPTRGGARNARDFALHLGRAGFVIVSGLAQGIDAAAHRGALDAGAPTVAFLGNGIDRVYPAANRELAHEIAAGGALASEFPLGTPPDRHHFPMRNRLIAGLSLGTIVVEAAKQSGSLITARLAGEQGREVFALPGSIHSPLSRGCHQLIRQGAKLVETADDIVSELSALTDHLQRIATELEDPETVDQETGEDRKALLALLGSDPVRIDDLAFDSGLTIDQVSSMLLILELEGKVEKLSGGRYSLLH